MACEAASSANRPNFICENKKMCTRPGCECPEEASGVLKTTLRVLLVSLFDPTPEARNSCTRPPAASVLGDSGTQILLSLHLARIKLPSCGAEPGYDGLARPNGGDPFGYYEYIHNKRKVPERLQPRVVPASNLHVQLISQEKKKVNPLRDGAQAAGMIPSRQVN